MELRYTCMSMHVQGNYRCECEHTCTLFTSMCTIKRWRYIVAIKIFASLSVKSGRAQIFSGTIKGTGVFHKTVRVCHVYCNFKIGFTCRITVIFGTLKDGSLFINTLASNICFSYRNMFQNGVDALSKIVDAFLSKSSKFHLVRLSDNVQILLACGTNTY